MMAINYDKSLYSRVFNKETRAAIDAINKEARLLGVWDGPDNNGEWGSQTTLRRKMDYLARWKAMRQESTNAIRADVDENLKGLKSYVSGYEKETDMDENVKLRKILSECATALGKRIAFDSDIAFFEVIPSEIATSLDFDRLYALCYLHDWNPPKEGQEHKWEPGKNVFPEIHAYYKSWQEAVYARRTMADPEKYWVVGARPGNTARLDMVMSKEIDNDNS